MATLALQDAGNGASFTTVAASGGGDAIPQGIEAGGWQLPVVLFVNNAAASAVTVTVDGMAGVSVPAGGRALIPVGGGNSYGLLRNITYSATASVTVAAVRLTGELE